MVNHLRSLWTLMQTSRADSLCYTNEGLVVGGPRGWAHLRQNGESDVPETQFNSFSGGQNWDRHEATWQHLWARQGDPWITYVLWRMLVLASPLGLPPVVNIYTFSASDLALLRPRCCPTHQGFYVRETEDHT